MSDLSSAIKQICEEKNLSYDAVIKTIESALSAAYRKDFGQKNQNIKVEFNEEDITKCKVYDIKIVVEDMPEEKEGSEEKSRVNETNDTDQKEEIRKFNPKTEIQITEAKELKKTIKIGEEIKTKLDVSDSYGRMAAQTAKQVIIQRLREAEREVVFNDFKEKEHEVVSGVIQRREKRFVLVDLGKSVGILQSDEQIVGEQYNPGERIKVYVKEVNLKTKGPEIILSRTSDEILKKVFYVEIPEIANGLIELKSVTREAGARSKVAVYTESENVDPIGSCVGQRGARIQVIISELGGEKVDIIEYDEDPRKFITNALSPAKILNIEINEDDKKAVVVVASDQLSLAIGKSGQNARLAAKLTGWKIDIKEVDGGEEINTEQENEEQENEEQENEEQENEEQENEDEENEDIVKNEKTAINGKEDKEDVAKEDEKNKKEINEEK